MHCDDDRLYDFIIIVEMSTNCHFIHVHNLVIAWDDSVEVDTLVTKLVACFRVESCLESKLSYGMIG